MALKAHVQQKSMNSYSMFHWSCKYIKNVFYCTNCTVDTNQKKDDTSSKSANVNSKLGIFAGSGVGITFHFSPNPINSQGSCTTTGPNLYGGTYLLSNRAQNYRH